MVLSLLGGSRLAALWLSFPREFWPKLKREPEYKHLVFASAVVLFILWLMQASIYLQIVTATSAETTFLA